MHTSFGVCISVRVLIFIKTFSENEIIANKDDQNWSPTQGKDNMMNQDFYMFLFQTTMLLAIVTRGTSE